jgi:hypothetical protein
MKIKLPELYFPKQTNILARIYQAVGGSNGSNTLMLQKHLWDYKPPEGCSKALREVALDQLETRANEIVFAAWEVLREGSNQ